ncbi:MAG: phage portal protein [Streptococcus mitis]|uniref:Phage portal protein n=1 Tax=Streptococcus mitis TaxID=28037 RepID=A0A942XBQ9_STRMT|nr:phage portal protein [Streptococcus mitis]
MELRGIEYLRKKLNLYQSRVNLRYKYYAMQHYRAPIGITIPAHVRAKYRATLGWTAKGVDCLADRLVFREFTNDDFNVTEIFDRNNPDILFDSAILAALIGSCCFIYISKGEDDEVRLQVIEASNATGVIDPITGLLVEGYAVLARDDYNQPTLEAYFEPNATHFIPKNGRPYSVANEAGIPLLIPVIHRPDAVRPFGRSRITRAGMYYQKEAEQTFERANITAEFYSWPQKYIIGLDPDAEQLETYKATVSSLLTISASDSGEKPSIGQFTTASMSPFTEQLRTAAAGFAGEMGLTLDDMGFVSDNPSSVEAIKASHENLRLAGRKAQCSLGAGLLNVAYVAACLRDEFHYARSQFVRTTVKWEPLFEADANTMTMIGDGVVKLNQALPGYINAESIRDLTGIAGDMSAKPVVSEGGSNGE